MLDVMYSGIVPNYSGVVEKLELIPLKKDFTYVSTGQPNCGH